MNNTTLTSAQLKTLCENLGIAPDDEENRENIRTDYSGRGMYGAQCLGFVFGSGEISLAQFVFELAVVIASSWDGAGSEHEPDLDDVREAMEDLTPVMDSMGRDTIAYWPEIGVEL